MRYGQRWICLWFLGLVVFSGDLATADTQCPSGMVYIPADPLPKSVPESDKLNAIPAFCMDQYEITQDEYAQVTGKKPSYFKGSRLPVESVSWYEALEYCGKLGKRLPDQWEWLKAARAGTSTKYYWGDDESKAGDYAWFIGNSGGTTHPVGSKKPNGYGLYDITGNVREWTADSSSPYGGILTSGGSWGDYSVMLELARRTEGSPYIRILIIGFRCVR